MWVQIIVYKTCVRLWCQSEYSWFTNWDYICRQRKKKAACEIPHIKQTILGHLCEFHIFTADLIGCTLVVSSIRQMPNRPSGELTLQLTESFSAITSPAAQLSWQNIFATGSKGRIALANLVSVVSWKLNKSALSEAEFHFLKSESPIWLCLLAYFGLFSVMPRKARTYIAV